MANIQLEDIYDGEKFQICAIVNNDKCSFEIFLDKQSKSNQRKVIALLKRKAEHGYIKNTEKFKKLQDEDLYEFKSYQIRILCFFDEGNKKLILLTHGFIKKERKTPKKEIKKANRLKDLYYSPRR